jgi:hypothetical protein
LNASNAATRAAAVDAITRRFGEQAITRARLVGKRRE